MSHRNTERVLVTGATGFLGFRTVAALLEAGLKVTALVRPDQVEKLAGFGDALSIVEADVWNKGSLKGRARGHGTVIHLIGSIRADPAKGNTFHQINLVSARNVATMAVGDGVPRMILLSTIVRPLSVPGEYVQSKREAEEYLQKSGLEWTIVRAPAIYSGAKNQIFLNSLSTVGGLFLFSWLVGRTLPLPVDIAARGLAQLVMVPEPYTERTIYAPTLRKLARQLRIKRPLARPRLPHGQRPEEDSEPPFGWLPPH